MNEQRFICKYFIEESLREGKKQNTTQQNHEWSEGWDGEPNKGRPEYSLIGQRYGWHSEA